MTMVTAGRVFKMDGFHKLAPAPVFFFNGLILSNQVLIDRLKAIQDTIQSSN